MNKTTCVIAVLTHSVLFFGQAGLCVAQDGDWIAETDSYNLDENWSTELVPEGGTASIANGGTAFVDDLVPEVVNVRLGQTSFGGHGTLEIRDGGELFATGLVRVGRSDFNVDNGFGRLDVHRGGELVALTLTSGGDAGSAIVLGGGDGSGKATLSVDERATLSRSLRIIGPDVEFSPLFLDFTNEHVLTAEITGTEHSTINVLEEVMLADSSLHVDFSSFTPSFGDSWTLIDAFFVDGEFGSVTANDLPPGAGVFVSYGEGGENGEVVDLSMGTRLTMAVDRGTGNVAIQNNAAGQTIAITGYTIDGINGADSSSNATLESESAIDLGEIYDFAPSTIGELGPDVAFEYEEGGETKLGHVAFSGPHNNVVLLVDPDTGAAAIQNQSGFNIDLDGYLISSDSGSLDAEAWTGLAGGDWALANPSEVHLAQLNLNSALALNANGQPVSIGSAFNFDDVDAQRDLLFEFHLAGGDTIGGVVEYGTLDIDVSDPLDCNGDGVLTNDDVACATNDTINPILDARGLVPGDLDLNGMVDFPDFLKLADGFGDAAKGGVYANGDIDVNGQIDFNDFLKLADNFGKTSAGAAANVPEPSSLPLAVLSMLGFLGFRRRRVRQQLSDAKVGCVTCECRRARAAVTSLLFAMMLVGSAAGQALTPSKQIFVSDSSDQAMIAADMDPGPLDDLGDIVARERRNVEQNHLQIRTFIEFDLSAISAEQASNPNFSATFLIDFVNRLNTVNDMQVVVGRVLDGSHPETEEGAVAGDSWTTEPGSLPLFTWGRSTGESTDPEFDEDRFVLVENVKTDALGTRQVDVTGVVANWVNGIFDNNGFSVAGGHDEFQGAGLNNARLIVGVPGDFNGDGKVDLFDFQVLADNFASHLDGPVTDGDIDFDGDVDLNDFGQFKEVFSSSQGQASTTAIPEPSSWCLSCWYLLALLRPRRIAARYQTCDSARRSAEYR